ncbi:MAG: ABC transporter permease [Vicinamibacterales bacterium]
MARLTLAERLYRLLLRCYPGEFRDDYEREMLLAFRERLTHDRQVGIGGVIHLWWQLVVDSIVRAPGEHLDVLRQDLRYASRSLRRAPLFALTAIATLALGVGANTAIFSVVHAVALRPLPYATADRLVRIWEKNDSLAVDGFAVSLPNFVSWHERLRMMEVAAWRGGSVTLRSTGDPIRVQSAAIGADYFRMLGAKPLIGRTFLSGDEAAGAERVAIIRDSLWRQSFSADPGVIGSAVTIGGQSHTIVGVIAEASVPLEAEFYTPLRINLAEEERDNHIASAIGLLRPGVSFEQARQEIEAVAHQLETEFPTSNKGWGITISTIYESIIPQETRRALFVILGAVGCVLLIACANVANLMLARAASRKREIALRMAIGAARRRLVRQVLTEGLLLAILGGGAGILVAYWSVPLMKGWLPAALPRANEATVNAPVLVFSLAVCLLTGLAFAVLPALASSAHDLIDSLKEGARGSSAGSTRSRQVLAAAQVALATILLVGAGLLVQSLRHLQRVELGFDPSNITTAMMGIGPERSAKPGAGWAFYQQFLERMAAGPGVVAVALSSGAPFGGGNTGMPINGVGETRLGSASLQTDWRMVSPDYFRAMRIPLLRGRYFSASNGKEDDGALIVAAEMARRMWGDSDPIGRQIKAGPNGVFTVVGVVGNVRNLDLSLPPAPTMYLSTANYLWPSMTVIVRAPEGAQAAAVMRSALRELDPQLALFNIRQMEDLIDQSAAQPRLNAFLVGSFAALAALLAAIGIYGVLAYLVSQRTQEIGIRMALGARRSAVLRLFLARGLWLALCGLLVGVAGALGAARWIGSMLFEVKARDPWTIAASVATVAAVAIIASYIPAYRATRVNPLLALRSD